MTQCSKGIVDLRYGLDLAIQTEQNLTIQAEQNLAIQTKHNEIDGFSTFNYFLRWE